MSRRPPYQTADIPISLATRTQLISASCDTDFEKEDWEIAAEAIDEWMRRHKPNAIALPAATGYQWKSLFLPDGTLLRTVFGGKNYHCIVEADGIVYNGKPVSPSGFVNAVGGIRRNAWRCTWILLPQTDQWRLADTLRTRVRPAPARAARHERPLRESAVPAPAAGTRPNPVPPPQQQEPITASVTCPPVQPASGHQSRQIDSNQAGLSGQQREAGSLSPPRCTRRGERRAPWDEQIRPSLRAELLPDLLPLLNRVCAIDEERRGRRPVSDPR